MNRFVINSTRHDARSKQSCGCHIADRFSTLEYASDERLTGYLDSAGGGAVVGIDGLFSVHPGELTNSMTAKANWS